MTDLPDLKIKALVNFPSQVIGGAGISVTKQAGVYTIDQAWNEFGVAGSLPIGPSSYFLSYDSVAKNYVLVPTAALPISYLRTTPAVVNFNAGNADTAIPIPIPAGFTRYRINNVNISGASGTLTTATFGIFTAPAGGGAAVVNAGTAININTAAENAVNNMFNAGANSASWNAATLYFRVGTPQGAPATATVILNIAPLS